MKGKNFSRILSFLLAIVISFTSLPSLALAEETTSPNTGKAKDKVLQEDIERPDTKLKVIVELEEEPLIDTATDQGIAVDELDKKVAEERTEKIVSEQEEVKASLEEEKLTIETGEEYIAAMNGFSATINSSDLKKVENIDSVKTVHIQDKYSRPEITPSMNYSKELIGLNITGNNLPYTGKGTVVAVIDSGVDPYHKDFVSEKLDADTVKLTEAKVNQIIASEGLKGEFKNLKVPYAYDYHDNDTNTKENAAEHMVCMLLEQ